MLKRGCVKSTASVSVRDLFMIKRPLDSNPYWIQGGGSPGGGAFAVKREASPVASLRSPVARGVQGYLDSVAQPPSAEKVALEKAEAQVQPYSRTMHRALWWS